MAESPRIDVFGVRVPGLGGSPVGELQDDHPSVETLAFEGGDGAAAGQEAASVFLQGRWRPVGVLPVGLEIVNVNHRDDIGRHRRSFPRSN